MLWRTKRLAQSRAGLTLGFVPTMGALHEGHLSLVRRSLVENDRTLVSIFVNPTQFENSTDLARYTKTLETELATLRDEGVHFVFLPSDSDLYPDGYRYRVTETTLSNVMEGAHRHGHFDGVLTVVFKLLQIVSSDRAYFGEKDWQQLEVVRTMVRDLNLEVNIIGKPIVRESDGLAMSSRNQYLSAEDRITAISLSQALESAQNLIMQGERSGETICTKIRQMVEKKK